MTPAARSFSTTDAAWRTAGAWLSSDLRIRSIAAKATRGLTSHEAARMSYSFGPREPNVRMNSRRPAA